MNLRQHCDECERPLHIVGNRDLCYTCAKEQHED